MAKKAEIEVTSASYFYPKENKFMVVCVAQTSAGISIGSFVGEEDTFEVALANEAALEDAVNNAGGK